MRHSMTLSQYVGGGGIWLECEDCGAAVNLGMQPTVGAVVEAFAEHQKTITEGDHE